MNASPESLRKAAILVASLDPQTVDVLLDQMPEEEAAARPSHGGRLGRDRSAGTERCDRRVLSALGLSATLRSAGVESGRKPGPTHCRGNGRAQRACPPRRTPFPLSARSDEREVVAVAGRRASANHRLGAVASAAWASRRCGRRASLFVAGRSDSSAGRFGRGRSGNPARGGTWA